jgi:PPK2 family polyphosphate:nucleotide phosphotransferase
MELKGPVIKDYMKQAWLAPGTKVRLNYVNAGWEQSENLKDMSEGKAQKLLEKLLEQDRVSLAKAQELLAASHEQAILVILQGMDTSGKDGTIRHVMSGVNPQGCNVTGFKVPSAEDHAHDFLWRYYKALPERGMIGIFNRSYYEDVLVVRVHPERMEKLPAQIGPVAEGFWEGRFKDINDFEKHLSRNGTLILKFFLHISKDEQKKRLLDRLNRKEKYWKFSTADLAERQYWDEYMNAYNEMLSATSTKYAPWFIVPSNDKWMARTIVASVITSAINGLDLTYPKVTAAQLKTFKAAKKALESE